MFIHTASLILAVSEDRASASLCEYSPMGYIDTPAATAANVANRETLQKAFAFRILLILINSCNMRLKDEAYNETIL